MDHSTCLLCGTGIPPKPAGQRGRKKLYCSSACSNRACYERSLLRPKEAVAIPDTECVGCGAAVVQSGVGKRRKWCTRACANKANIHRLRATRPYAPRCTISIQVCAFCAELFAARTGRKVRACRAEDCQRRIKNEQTRSWFDAYRVQNGTTYQNDKYYDKRVEASLKRRGLLVDGYESFKFSEIFNRDGWVCQLCFEPVDPDLKWPHRMSKSLDHIVPVSRGGKHTKENTQLAHVACNSSKGNSLDSEVMVDGGSWHEAKAGRSAA